MKTVKAIAFLLLLAVCAFLVTSSLQSLAGTRREVAAASAAVSTPSPPLYRAPAANTQTANEFPPPGTNLDNGPTLAQGGGPPDFGGPGGRGGPGFGGPPDFGGPGGPPPDFGGPGGPPDVGGPGDPGAAPGADGSGTGAPAAGE